MTHPSYGPPTAAWHRHDTCEQQCRGGRRWVAVKCGRRGQGGGTEVNNQNLIKADERNGTDVPGGAALGQQGPGIEPAVLVLRIRVRVTVTVTVGVGVSGGTSRPCPEEANRPHHRIARANQHPVGTPHDMSHGAGMHAGGAAVINVSGTCGPNDDAAPSTPAPAR